MHPSVCGVIHSALTQPYFGTEHLKLKFFYWANDIKSQRTIGWNNEQPKKYKLDLYNEIIKKKMEHNNLPDYIRDENYRVEMFLM